MIMDRLSDVKEISFESSQLTNEPREIFQNLKKFRVSQR